ncbi:hypothetical protein SRABI98_00976 [Microbacterium sp. Bi98]|uniref:hypothetical protein n=1 Tax=Microbacterium sp. Bi98 TaxID=2821116 RepID=UPI001DF03D3F|nr:hypothetical protein [Microbacterium sp. Bi98]CAH0159046.1 hypothetical protein SRABI98_00976 [Microbacterium sp. Bi98]
MNEIDPAPEIDRLMESFEKLRTDQLVSEALMASWKLNALQRILLKRGLSEDALEVVGYHAVASARALTALRPTL